MSTSEDFNPYEVLGLSQDCVNSDIKAAYRRQVHIHHPDKGGTVEGFQAVIKAFAILMDPDQRRNYDDAGFIEPEAPADQRKEVMAVLVSMFDASIDFVLNAGVPLDAIDVITNMSQQCADNRRSAEEHLAKISHQVDELRRFMVRLRREGDGENLFAVSMSRKLRLNIRTMSSLRRQVQLFDQAMVELTIYSSAVDMVHSFMTGFYGNHTPPAGVFEAYQTATRTGENTDVDQGET